MCVCLNYRVDHPPGNNEEVFEPHGMPLAFFQLEACCCQPNQAPVEGQVLKSFGKLEENLAKVQVSSLIGSMPNYFV